MTEAWTSNDLGDILGTCSSNETVFLPIQATRFSMLHPSGLSSALRMSNVDPELKLCSADKQRLRRLLM
jgi:hypothetical protein